VGVSRILCDDDYGERPFLIFYKAVIINDSINTFISTGLDNKPQQTDQDLFHGLMIDFD